MGTVHRLDAHSAAPALADAVEAFLAEVDNHNTVRSYGTALRALVAEFGTATAVVTLDDEATVDRIGRWFVRRWGKSAPATVNTRLDARPGGANRDGSSAIRRGGSAGVLGLRTAPGQSARPTLRCC